MLFRSLSLGLLWCAWALCVSAAENPYVKSYPETGALKLEFRDNINSPIYSWPRTLLSYPVRFPKGNIRPGQLQVVDAATRERVPVQLSEVKTRPDGALSFARVNFFSDLPPGGQRAFELTADGAAQPAKAPRAVVAKTSGEIIEVDAGALQIRIPASRVIQGNASVPGPLLAINRGKGWVGESRILSDVKKVERIETQTQEQGDLFHAYRITYSFAGGETYAATVRLALDYPFVDFSEQMNGLEEKDHVTMEMAWTGLNPARRFAASGWMCPKGGLGIDQPVLTHGSMEEPHWMPLDVCEDPAKDMIFRLAAYQGNAPRDAVPAMSFWEAGEDAQEIGVFVPDTKGWNDGQYMNWQPTARLQVHFRYADKRLYWSWPLATGVRATGIVLNAVKEGESAVESVQKIYQKEGAGRRGAFVTNGTPSVAIQMRYAQHLRSWYGALNLDRVKDWQLSYPESARKPVNPFSTETAGDDEGSAAGKSAAELEKYVLHSALMVYPLGLDLAIMNISHRIIHPIEKQYLRLHAQLTPEQKKRVDAVLLLSAYLNAGEDLAPMRTCVTGCPNMSADSFSVPALISFLFPDHPMVPEWKDQFEKVLELQACYNTRPEVPLLDSKGGRWTESLGTYNWAYLFPTGVAQTALTILDGRNRTANPWAALRARWMVDELSAPVHNPDPYQRQQKKLSITSQTLAIKPGTELTPQNGFERQYPAHGAHGSGTGMTIPDMVPAFGRYMRQYDPLAAEYSFWAARQLPEQTPGKAKGEHARNEWTNWELGKIAKNNGTNPRLESAKYTGHGIILRAGVGTPEELSIHLDQVDQGPNYRWGNNGEGSSGVLYFFAGGQVWSGHERENTGDHQNDDTTGNTNFGVVSRGAYRTIGENILERPLHNFEVAQFAEITARTGPSAYSWPAYKSRSILLAGTDYMVICDDARGIGRFSWFTAKDLPFPKIVFLQPLGTRTDHLSMVQTAMSKGIMRDAPAPSVALVTHKKDGVEMEEMTSKPHPVLEDAGIMQYARDRKSTLPDGVYRVKTPTSRDLLFRDTHAIVYDSAGQVFSGKAGLIRSRTSGATELALFQGTKIGAKGVVLSIPEKDEVAASAVFEKADRVSGMCSATSPSQLTILFDAPASLQNTKVYLDGALQTAKVNGNSVTIALPAGKHVWECAAGLPKPLAPSVLRTENAPGAASVFFTASQGAAKYRVEVSRDGGNAWQTAGETDKTVFELKNADASKSEKVHVRVLAFNAEQQSAPGREYPVYFGNQPPLPPDGVFVVLGRDRAELSWGEVLGVKEYRLYRRIKGESEWRGIYSGLDRKHVDSQAKGTVLPAMLPGWADNISADDANPVVYEYAVSAINDNGESAKSYVVDSDSTSWRNWWPAGQERRYKRQTGYWLPPYVTPEMIPPANYPMVMDAKRP